MHLIFWQSDPGRVLSIKPGRPTPLALFLHHTSPWQRVCAHNGRLRGRRHFWITQFARENPSASRRRINSAVARRKHGRRRFERDDGKARLQRTVVLRLALYIVSVAADSAATVRPDPKCRCSIRDTTPQRNDSLLSSLSLFIHYVPTLRSFSVSRLFPYTTHIYTVCLRKKGPNLSFVLGLSNMNWFQWKLVGMSRAHFTWSMCLHYLGKFEVSDWAVNAIIKCTFEWLTE